MLATRRIETVDIRQEMSVLMQNNIWRGAVENPKSNLTIRVVRVGIVRIENNAEKASARILDRHRGRRPLQNVTCDQVSLDSGIENKKVSVLPLTVDVERAKGYGLAIGQCKPRPLGAPQTEQGILHRCDTDPGVRCKYTKVENVIPIDVWNSQAHLSVEIGSGRGYFSAKDNVPREEPDKSIPNRDCGTAWVPVDNPARKYSRCPRGWLLKFSPYECYGSNIRL